MSILSPGLLKAEWPFLPHSLHSTSALLQVHPRVYGKKQAPISGFHAQIDLILLKE